ncbi:hypothetical protein [Sphingomonas sp. LR55]|uniref:hypothetical protein n=1 Tax=Sphingomonas sp. LR55 TaxID=3050231 RepID=UPI002FE155E3
MSAMHRSPQRAVALAPREPSALTLQGEVIRDRYGLVAALPWFEAALKRDAYYHPALIEYAATLGDVGRNADMLVATRRALQARPGSPQALYLQAVLAARAGRIDLARALLRRTGERLVACRARCCFRRTSIMRRVSSNRPRPPGAS